MSHLSSEQSGGKSVRRAQAYIAREEPIAVSERLISSAEMHRDNDYEGGGNAPSNDFRSLCSVRPAVVVCCSVVILVFAVTTATLLSSVHRIDEGNVGVYYRNGALRDTFSLPGIHWMTPFITEMIEIGVRPQTDTLPAISSITRDGIQNTFYDVQVLSNVKPSSLVPLIRKFGMRFRDALIFDRIKEELRIFCANHTIDEVYNTMFLEIVQNVKDKVEASIGRLGDDGIQILNLVVPKPDIPPDIAHNYKQVKVQWTEQLVATQQQKTEQIKKETESLKAVADAERQKRVLQIEIQKQVLQKEGDKNLSLLENEIVKMREQNKADVESYLKRKQAEANQALYTKEFVQLEMARSLSNNTKFFFSGENSMLGGIVSKIFSDN